MKVLIDIEYFAPSIYYFTLSEMKYGIFEQYERFQKMTFRNRCVVAGAEGPVLLTIPLEGGRNQRTLMKDLRIRNSEKWQQSHFRTLTSVYNKSPYFEYYRDELEQLFEKEFVFLVDWNMECFRWVCDKMSISVSTEMTSGYLARYSSDEYLDWRNKLKPSTINTEIADYPVYPQVFEERTGFIPNLSILDFLFCNGAKLSESRRSISGTFEH